MKKAYQIIIIIVVLVLLVVSLVYWLWPKPEITNNAPGNLSADGSLRSPEFMTDSDKELFGLSSNIKAQIISREEDGGISVYKIIRNDNDIVADPSQLPSISPRLEK